MNPVFSDVTVSNATNNATTDDGSVTFTSSGSQLLFITTSVPDSGYQAHSASG